MIHTPQTLAQIWNCPVRTIQDYCRQLNIPMIGGTYVIPDTSKWFSDLSAKTATRTTRKR